MASSVTLIIPAAGSGSRLNRDIPKPFIKVVGKSILEHTVGRFLNQEGLARVVVAVSVDYVDAARRILERTAPDTISTAVVEGGEERQHSILNALEVAGDVDLVMVHDAVRPFVTPDQINACCKAAEEADGAVVGVPVKDTIKQLDTRGFIADTPSRKFLWQAQTPQVFKKEVLLEAYQGAFAEGFIGTDDASLVERLGFSVKMVAGDRTNFKITYPLDLKLASMLLGEKPNDE